MIVGVVSLVVVFGVRRIAPRVPGALVLVVGGLIASRLLGLGDRGVALVGDVPGGFPSLQVPNVGLMWDHAGTVAIAAVALVLIGFSQTAGDARTFAAKHRYQVDIDQESVAQGLANTGAGLFQGMPVSTSLSASSLNDHSGARTGLASLTSGLTVLLTLIFLAPLFSDLPKPVLAALIIEAVIMGMINIPEMRRLARVQPFDFWVAIAAIIGTLAFGVLAGVMIGIGLSLLWLIGVATSDALEDRLRAIIHSNADLTAIVLDCAGINFIDSQGSAKMSDVLRLTDESGITLRLARVKPAVSATLERDGVLQRIGAGNIHGNVSTAVQAQLDGSAPPRGGPEPEED